MTRSDTYDAVVIGAGHNGLCLAAYLQRAGLRTVVVERRHEEGGGINTEEPVLPAYRHNMHAQYMEFFDMMPMIRRGRPCAVHHAGVVVRCNSASEASLDPISSARTLPTR